ncbi:MAG: hypothetical protein RBS80_22750 [Thermoguttaceae bacterium]|jgi:tetratricopeptide (TPR) repeat protein|nr:hypothetical protein [Thermoguttaceae bacterium]
MPIDAYSLCPGGTGKKIKFCCSDLLPELQKLRRMVEGDQILAALGYADQVLAKHPDRACLLATRAELLRSAGRTDELVPHAARFLEAHPENQLAWAESAVAAAVTGDYRRAVECVYRAMECVEEHLYSTVYEAMDVVAQVAVVHKQWGAALGMWRLQAQLAPNHEAPRRAIGMFRAQRDIPLLLRSSGSKGQPPEDAPWSPRLTEALVLVLQGRPRQAAERIAALADELPGEPLVWQWLAELRSTLADTPGEIDALRRLASLDIPSEDAEEAEARAMLVADDPLGDGVDMLRIVWAVEDVEKLQTAIPLDSRCMLMPERPTEDDEGPPPRAIFVLLDRRNPAAPDVAPDTLARPRAQARFFGRQTDREARLEVAGFLADQRGDVESQVAELAGDALGRIIEQEVIGRASRSIDLIEAEFVYPPEAEPNTVRAAVQQYGRQAILDRWPEVSLGALGGRTPREVAESGPDESQRRKLAAAVLALQLLVETNGREEIFAELRSRLGLPSPGPIDPEQVSVRNIPIIRLDRVMAEKLSDEDLGIAFGRAVAYQFIPGVRKFAAALVEREHLGTSPERRHAIEQLAYTQDDLPKAMDYVELGRRACEAAGQSNVEFDFVEINLGLAHGSPDKVPHLLEHIQQSHFAESGVPERFSSLLIRLGLINPDGTPGPAAVAAQRRAEMARAAGHGGVGSTAQAEPGKLWTPESETGGKGGKLWTPD